VGGQVRQINCFLQAVVEEYIEDSKSYGALVLPTFFINGRKEIKTQPYVNLQSFIEEELTKANK